MDLSKLSTKDLVALRDNDLSRISTDGLQFLKSQYSNQQDEPVTETPVESPAERTLGGTLKDIGIAGLRGAIKFPQLIAGLADIPTMGRYSKALEGVGYRPDDALKILEQEYSPAQQAAFKRVGEAEGFMPTLTEAIKNPSVPLLYLGESLPQMLGGGVAARAIRAAVPGMSAAVAGGLGEGVMGAGFAAAQIRGENAEGVLSPKQSLAALASGLGTAVFGVIGGKLSSKLGLDDIDTLIAAGGSKAAIANQAKSGFFKSIVGAGISEGVFEEMPQSIQEQMWQNWATDKPLTEGVGKSAALGLLTGSVAGGIGGGIGRAMRGNEPIDTQAPPETTEAPQLDPEQYKTALAGLQGVIPVGGTTDSAKLTQTLSGMGIQNPEEYLNQAKATGDIKSYTTPFFDVQNASGNVLFRSSDEAIANSAAERLNAQQPQSASVVPGEVTRYSHVNDLVDGAEIVKGQFKPESTTFDLSAGDTPLSKGLTAEDAEAKAQRLTELRNKKAASFDSEIKKNQDSIDKNTLELETAEADGKAGTPEYEALDKQVKENNALIQPKIDELQLAKRAYAEPVMVTQSRPEAISEDGFTVFKDNKPVQHFATEELARTAVSGATSVDQAADQQPTDSTTPEAKAAVAALRERLLPFMKRLNLDGSMLKILDSIESGQGAGDGYYANQVIAVALNAANPMGTLRHETIHALKALGAFKPNEWRVLEERAKSEWIDKFIRQRTVEGGRNMYKAYKALYQQDNKGSLVGFDAYITEEAIADAFKYFNQTKPPVGLIGNIYNRIEKFFAEIKSALNGQGIETAEQIFTRVEAGQMRPTAAPTGNAPRYQMEEAKEKGKAPAITTAVAVTPAAVAVTKRAKPTKVMTMADLGKVIPASERVVSKKPGRLLNGKKFSNADLKNVGEGFLVYKNYGESDAEGRVKNIWEESIADVENFVSGSREGAFIKDLVKSLGAKPPTAKFLNDSLSLPDSARYWYETSAEAVDQTTLNTKNKDLLINIISATSQNVPPLPNMRRGISVISEYFQNKPIETDLISKNPVADAISNRNIQTLKFGNFADTMKFINGYTKNPPVSTNDRQVAAIFNMEPDEFAKNHVLYAVVSKFYAKIRDSQNEMQGKGKQPYESWQIQALNWVEERGDNTSYGKKTADSYDQAIEVITEQLKKAGIPLDKGKIGMATLKDPRVPNLLSGTMDVFQESVKATVESNTLLNKAGSEANQEYKKIKNINEPWARNLRTEFLMIQTRVLKKLSSSKLIEQVAKLATGQNVKAFAMSRMDANARGTFEGKLSPNIRIPMFYRKGETKTLITDRETDFILSVIGSGLDQAAMAGSLFKPDVKGETFRVFLPDRKITDDEATTFEKNVGFPLNLYDVPNGAVVEINIGGYDTRPTAASVRAALSATFGNNVNAKLAKASYKSTYLTKEKVDYAPSYREVIYDYRDSKFGRGNKNGFRRPFDDSLAKIGKSLIAIANERDGQFEEFTKESKTKRADYKAYKQKIGSKTDWAVMGGPSGGKYQLTAARIDVDGVMRPTRNNKGSLIASTEEAIRNFWRWFGNSKMVDDKGRPRLMFHGTAGDFQEFNPEQANAVFITDNLEFANEFATQTAEDTKVQNFEDFLTKDQIEDAKAETLRRMDDLTRREYKLTQKSSPYEFADINEWANAVKDRLPSRANIMPLYVKSENFFDFDNDKHVQQVVDGLIKQAKGNPRVFSSFTPHLFQSDYSPAKLKSRLSQGDWGIIEHPDTIKVIQGLDFDGISMKERIAKKNYAVFKPTQVKSAVGNLGTFDEKNPNIRYSLRDDIRNSMGQGHLDAVDRVSPARVNATFANRMASAISPDGRTAFRQRYLNKYEAIERLSKRIAASVGQGFRGQAELLADTSAIAATLQSDRASGVAAEAFMSGVPVYKNGFTKVSDLNGRVKGLIPIFEPLMKYKDPFVFQMFQFYAATKRGSRLMKKGILTPVTQADLKIGADYAAKFPEFVTVFNDYQEFNNGLVRFLIDTGVLTKSMGDEFMKYSDYIPFYRQLEGQDTVGPKLFNSLSGVRPPQKMKGGDAPLADFMETVVRNARAAIDSGMKNVASQRIARDVMRLNSPNAPYAQRLNNHPGGFDVIKVRENGIDVSYRVADPLLVEAMSSMHNVGLGPLWQMAAYPTKLLRNLVTKDPGFMLANLVRDSMQAWSTSGTSMVPIVDTFKQFAKVLANQSPEARALKAAGIGAGYEFAGDIKASTEAVQEILRKRTGNLTSAEKAMLPLSKIWDTLEKGSNASDLATRAEIYKKTMERTGGNEAEAMYQALEVMNFGRMGNSPMIQVISALVPFFNARVQGLDVLFRSAGGYSSMFGTMATENNATQQKAFIVRTMTILGLSMMYYMLASDSDEYKRASPEVRDNNWIIGKVKIPIPFEIGVLFKVMPERIAAYYFGNDTGKDLQASVIRNIVSTLKINPVPQIALPLVELGANHSFFTGEDITPKSMEHVAPQFQERSGTSEWAKKLSAAISAFAPDKMKLSPIQIDYLLSGYTGTMGTYAGLLVDSIINTAEGKTKPSMSIEQTPVLKRFFASDKSGGTMTAFYDLKEQVDEVTRTSKLLLERGSVDDYRSYMQDKGKLLALKPLTENIDTKLSELRKLRNMVNFSKMGGDEKRETLDNIRMAEIRMTEQIQGLKKRFAQM